MQKKWLLSVCHSVSFLVLFLAPCLPLALFVTQPQSWHPSFIMFLPTHLTPLLYTCKRWTWLQVSYLAAEH